METYKVFFTSSKLVKCLEMTAEQTYKNHGNTLTCDFFLLSVSNSLNLLEAIPCKFLKQITANLIVIKEI